MIRKILLTVAIIVAALLTMGGAQASDLPTPTPTRAEPQTPAPASAPTAPDVIETSKVSAPVWYENKPQNGSQEVKNQQNPRNPLISADFSISGGYALPDNLVSGRFQLRDERRVFECDLFQILNAESILCGGAKLIENFLFGGIWCSGHSFILESNLVGHYGLGSSANTTLSVRAAGPSPIPRCR